MLRKFSIAIIFFIQAIGCTRVVVVHEKSERNDTQVIDGTIEADGAFRDINQNINIDSVIRDVGKADVKHLDTSSSKDGSTILGNWVTISAGTFTMGSPSGEACRGADETPHQVTLTHPFEIQTTEVTQLQFNSLRGYNPANFKSCGNNCPVENINWHEAAAYCNELSIMGGYATCYDCGGSGSNVTCAPNASFTSGNIYDCPGYRLPTEAEWEYAYRAGTTTALHNNTNVVNCNSTDTNSSAISWNLSNSSSTTHIVGSKLANNWGLYDMAGNVWEWCNDWAANYGTASVTDPFGGAGTSRVLRSGSWGDNPNYTRAASRINYTPMYRCFYDLGVRCVRTK